MKSTLCLIGLAACVAALGYETSFHSIFSPLGLFSLCISSLLLVLLSLSEQKPED